MSEERRRLMWRKRMNRMSRSTSLSRQFKSIQLSNTTKGKEEAKESLQATY